MNLIHTVKVNRSIELINQLIKLADTSVWLILEGDLSQFSGNGLTGVERIIRENATFALSRPNNRVAIPLIPDNVPTLKLNVLPRVGIRAQICNVFLECNGRTLFTAYDHFKNGAQFHDWISDEELNRLAHEGIIELEKKQEIEVEVEVEDEDSPSTSISHSNFRRSHEPFYDVSQPYGGYSYGKY